MSKTKVLIVDDDTVASRLLALGLEKTGSYEVKVENVATHALNSAREFRPDVILLDVCMPGADGGDVAFSIHSNAALRSTPIIFLNVACFRAGSEQCRGLRGGYEFLPKLASVAKVIECIGRHLGQGTETATKLSLTQG